MLFLCNAHIILYVRVYYKYKHIHISKQQHNISLVQRAQTSVVFGKFREHTYSRHHIENEATECVYFERYECNALLIMIYDTIMLVLFLMENLCGLFAHLMR